MWKWLSQEEQFFVGEKIFDDCDIVIKEVAFGKYQMQFVAEISSKDDPYQGSAKSKYQRIFGS